MYTKFLRNVSLIIFITFFFVISLSSYAAEADNAVQVIVTPDAVEEQVPLVASVEVAGCRHIPEGSVLEQVVTRVGEQLNEVKLSRDVAAIKGMGYFQEVSYEISEGEDGAVVRFNVQENPIIESISIEGNTLFTDDVLRSLIDEKPGEIMNFDTLRADVRKIEAYYRDKGYALMRVTSVENPAQSQDGSMVFHVLEGKIGDIHVQGNTFTKNHVITRELQLAGGSIFNAEVLKNDYRRVMGLNFFNSVEPNVAPGSSPDTVDVVWNIEEKRTNSINLGGAYGSQQGFSLFVDLHMDNFRGNGELMSIKGEWGQKLVSYQFKYHNPWIASPKTSLTTRLWNTDGAIDESGQGRAYRIGGDLAVGRQLNNEWSASSRLKYENVNDMEGSDDNRIFMLGGTLTYDTRDLWFNPGEGEHYSISLENSNNLFGGTVEMTKYYINLEKFIPITSDKKQVLASRLAWAEAYGKVPDTERFFLGGGTTIRGFRDGEPFGRGSRRLMGNIEYRINFNETIQGVLFYDFGRIGTVDDDLVNFEGDNNWRTGYGAGVRINTVIPIRIDFAWTDGKGNLVDDEGTREYSAVHFSMGHTF